MNETKLWNTAIYHFTERNYHKAKDAFSEIPFTAEVEYNIAICLINLKCYEAAIESLKRALVYDPMLMVAYFQLAHCQSVIKETNGAIESLTNCLIAFEKQQSVVYDRLNPTPLYVSQVIYNRSLCFSKLGDLQNAALDMEIYRKLRPAQVVENPARCPFTFPLSAFAPKKPEKRSFNPRSVSLKLKPYDIADSGYDTSDSKSITKKRADAAKILMEYF